MLSEKFQSLFTQTHTPGEGWNDYKLFTDVIPREVAKTSVRPSKFPVCSWSPDPEMMDSLGIRSFLDAKEDEVYVPSLHEKAKIATAEGKVKKKVTGLVTTRKASEKKKKDSKNPEQLYKTEICKQWKDDKVPIPIHLLMF